MKHFSLSLRLLRRNWQAGESRVLLVALFIAVMSVTTVGFFADRVESALNQQANELIAADAVVITSQPARKAFREEATRLQLATAESMAFPSMVSGDAALNQGVKLSEIKAVTDAFPLRGKLRITDAPGQPDREADGIPQPGTVWVPESLLANINANVGDFLNVGNIKLKVAQILTREPDSVMDYSAIAPRVLMNRLDLDKTGLIQEGSRISYRFMVAGERKSIAEFNATFDKKLLRGERLDSVLDTRSEVKTALERAQRFLGLATLLSVILASVAVALAARRFSQRQLDSAAMMRCLGATQADIFALNLWQFVALGFVACVLGTMGGFIAQLGLASILAGLFTVSLPPPTPIPALQGAVVGLVLLLGFTLPPLLQLRKVPTLRVLRRDLDPFEASSAVAYLFGFASLVALIIWRAGDVRLGVYAVGGFVGTLLIAALAGWLLMQFTGTLRSAGKGSWSAFWRHGIANMKRRFAGSLVQIMALGLGIMAMLLLTLVRLDFISNWQAEVSTSAPNRFVINIQQSQLREVQDFFKQQNIETPNLHPMIRGRLVAINGADLPARQAQDTGDQPENKAERGTEDNRNGNGNGKSQEGVRRAPGREWNLSWSATLQTDNKVVAGKFWDAHKKFAPGEGEFSMEEGNATRMNIKVGDSLTFDIAGTRFSAKVSNLRKVEWDSFGANFFVVASPGVLENYPTSYITSFRVPVGQESVMNNLVRKFPNLTVIDLTAIMEQVKRITDQVANAVSYVFLFTLAAGLVVLYAAIAATQDERVFDAAIMRTLGASRRQMFMLQLSEFLTIGLLAGAVAAGGAMVLGWVLADKVLSVPYVFNPWIPLIGLLGGGLGVSLAGLLGTRKAVNSPPLATIRGLA